MPCGHGPGFPSTLFLWFLLEPPSTDGAIKVLDPILSKTTFTEKQACRREMRAMLPGQQEMHWDVDIRPQSVHHSVTGTCTRGQYCVWDDRHCSLKTPQYSKKRGFFS